MNDQPDAKPAGPLASPGPWNLVAEGYNEVTVGFLEQFSRSALARLHYGRQTRVIDVACGPGTTALLLSPSVRRVICVDFSAKMLGELRRKMAAAGVGNLDIVEADGQALPFGDASFDIGISMFGLMFFPNRGKGFAELHRVLAPGGQILVSSWAPAAQSPLVEMMTAALQPDDAPAQAPSPPSGLEDRDLFEAELRKAGFTDIRIEAVMHQVEVNDVAQFWNGTVRGTAPVAMLKQHSTDAEWAEIEHRALDRLTRALGNHLPTALSATAWLATARKR